jgi:hypothetical protein
VDCQIKTFKRVSVRNVRPWMTMFVFIVKCLAIWKISVKIQCYLTSAICFYTDSGKIRADSNRSVGNRPSYSPKLRLIANITAFSKKSALRISVKILETPFHALFDTGAAKILLHIDVFNKLCRISLIALVKKTMSRDFN